MKVIRQTISWNDSSRKKINLIPIGDIHYGTIYCQIQKLVELVQWIKATPDTYWLGMGDMIECINPKDKRYDPALLSPKDMKVDKLVFEQRDRLVKILSPIKEKCLCWLTGNHEDKYRLCYGGDLGEDMAHLMGVPYMGYSGFLVLTLQRTCANSHTSRTVTIYVNHGYGGGKKPGGKINQMIDLASQYHADIYLMGHCHQLAIHKFLIHRVAGTEIMQESKVVALTGTFYGGLLNHEGEPCIYTSYQEKAGYPMPKVGVAKIQIEPFKEQTVGHGQYRNKLDIHISE